MTPCSCLRSVSVSACPCFITRSWWITGLITDGCQWVRHTARARPQNNRDVLSSALPGSPDRPRHHTEGGLARVSEHSAQGGAREIEFFIIDKWLGGPGGCSMSGPENMEMRNVYVLYSYIRYCIRILISDLFSQWSVIPLVVSARVF